jgi:hypothetical protein
MVTLADAQFESTAGLGYGYMLQKFEDSLFGRKSG